MKKIDLVFFDAGGGHRSAAKALLEVLERQQRDWDVRLFNLQDVLDPLDFFRKFTGVRSQDVYNLVLRKGWTLGAPAMLRAMHLILRAYHRKQVALLRDFWRQRTPHLLVSLIPNFNRALRESLPASSRMVTALTDLADYPPHFWIERQDQFFICGTERAARQAREMGHPSHRVFRTSGMILNPRFYEPLDGDRAGARERLGLDPVLPTALILFGAYGSPEIARIAARLQDSGLRLQIIAICGHNKKLAARLASMERRVAMHVEGFTREIPRLMHLSDFFIGKPGPGSISEALAMKLPVVVERNAWTLPQERYNAVWIDEQGAGLKVNSFRKITEAVEQMLDPAQYARFRAAAAAQHNRAVFEIPDILEQILRV